MEVFRQLVSLLVPPRCLACGAGCEVERTLCRRCGAALALARPIRQVPPAGVDDCWSVGPYDGVPRRLVTALKFGSLTVAAQAAAEAIAAGAPAELLAGALVPVPAAPRRLRQRGFDPAGEIARALAELRGLDLVECLARADGPRQVGRPRRERTSHPPRVRLVAPAPPVAVLFDDVWTTGATLGACAAALRAGGTTRISALTLAHTR